MRAELVVGRSRRADDLDPTRCRTPGRWRTDPEGSETHRTRQVAVDPTTCQILRDHHNAQLSVASQVGCVLRPDALVIADLLVDPTGECRFDPTG